jgi:hypothetical protein
MKQTIRSIPWAVAIAGLFLAACGDSDDDPQPAPPPVETRIWVVPDTATALTADQRAAFTGGNLYFNAHTAVNAGGEIRGQLDREGTVRFATLSGAQETPSVTTAAFGAGALSVDESTGRVRGFIVTSGLVSPTAAHVHQAARGTPGGIIVPLTGGPEIWVVPDGAAPLTAPQIAAFLAGELYFNAHTAANANGEIRGQLDKVGEAKFASLNGAQETPAVPTAALGAGALAVNAATGEPSGFFVTTGLANANAAHVHQAARGTPGGIIVPLTGGPNLWVVPDDAVDLTADQRTAFLADELYFNAHTPAYASGEIRGQLDQGGTARLASLDGTQETPAVNTTAFGGALLAVDDTTGDVAGFLVTAGLVNATAAHVHQAARGTPGGIIVPLVP